MTIFIVLLLAIAAPVNAQTRTWTNSDLNKPITWQGARPTDEQLRGFRERQPVIAVTSGPPADVVVLSDPTFGPYGKFRAPLLPTERDRLSYRGGIPFYYPYGPLLAPATIDGSPSDGVRLSGLRKTGRPAARTRSHRSAFGTGG